jgi:hypothetical protein
MGLLATALSYGPPVLRNTYVAGTIATEARTAIEDQRSNISAVGTTDSPCEGSVLGVWVFSGNVYAFRNKSGAATAGMYKSTSTGWSEVDLGTALNFDGTTTNGEFVVGSVVTGAAGASGTVAAVSYSGLWETGAKGVVVLTGITGTFVDNEDLSSPTLAFDAGTVEIKEDDVITGVTSGKTATVKSVLLSSGSWDGDDAVGYLSISGNTGTWTDGEKIQVGGNNRADVNGASQPSSRGLAKANGTQYAQTLSPGGKYEFVTYNFKGNSAALSMYGVSTVDNGFSYDGTSFIKIQTGMETDTPQHVIAHKKHLFFSFPGASVQHSSIAKPLQWSPITGAAEITLGDEVSGFSIEVKEVMSIFTRNDTYMLYGSSSADWNLTRFHTGTGAIPYTMQKMDQTFFLDDRGITSIFTVQYYGDFQSSVASGKIDPYIQKKKDNAVLSLRVRGKNQYRLFFDDKTGLAMTYMNRENVGIMPFTLSHQLSCCASGEDSNGFEVLYGGFDDGYVRRIDSGTSFDGLTVDSFIRTSYHNYGSPQVKKRFREIGLELNADTSTTLSVYPTFDYGGTFSPRSSPSATEYSVSVTSDAWNEDDLFNYSTGVTVVASERVKINGVGTNMGMIIKNSSIYDKPITLQGVVVDYSTRGVRR